MYLNTDPRQPPSIADRPPSERRRLMREMQQFLLNMIQTKGDDAGFRQLFKAFQPTFDQVRMEEMHLERDENGKVYVEIREQFRELFVVDSRGNVRRSSFATDGAQRGVVLRAFGDKRARRVTRDV